jgi:hypothetical protein
VVVPRSHGLTPSLSSVHLCRTCLMEPYRRKSLIHSLLIENDPILATEEYSGATPLHLGLEFLQASDEAISGTEDEGSTVFIFTPTKEAYENHEESNEGDMDWADDVEEENEGSNSEQRSSITRHKRRSQTQLCIDDWLFKHGARGKTAKLLSRIQIL